MAKSPALSGAQSVGRASLITMLSLLGSRVLGILRDTIMASQFGRGELTDAYTLAFQIPDLLFFLIAGGALSSAFIPVFTEYLSTDREREAWQIFSSVATIMASVLVLFIGITFVFAEPIVALMNGDAKTQFFPLIAQMSRILLPAQFAFFIGGLMFGTLYAHQRFSIPGLGPNIYNLGIIFGALVVSHFVSPGIIGMAWGALGGALIGNLLMPLWEMRKLGAQFRVSFDTKHPGVRKVFKLMLPVVLGLSLPGVYAMIMRYYGSHFEAGIVTSLDLSNKLMQAPLGVFGQAFAIAAFPALSQFFAQGDMPRYREQLVRTLRMTIYVTVPVAGLLGIMAPDVIQALLGYGKFRTTDPSSVILCLQIFAFGIPAWCLHPILMRGYFAMQNTVKPIVLGTVTTALFFGLCQAGLATGLGWRGLPLASSISAWFLVTIMLVSLNKDSGGLNVQMFMGGLMKSLAAGLAFGLLVWLVAVLVPRGGADTTGNLVAFARIGLAVALGGAVYHSITRAWGMGESDTLGRALSRFKRSTSA